MPESTRARVCTTTKDDAALFAPTKRLCISIERAEYDRILAEPVAFRAYLDSQIAAHPELFPAVIQHGYHLHSLLPPSRKLPGLRLRRIKLTAPEAAGAVYSIAPSFVLPSMTGYTETVEKALFLRRFGVPFWGLAYVFGHRVDAIMLAQPVDQHVVQQHVAKLAAAFSQGVIGREVFVTQPARFHRQEQL